MILKPFFVTGSPKSGTTWLAKLLDGHPEINCKGEACLHAFNFSVVRISNEYNKLLEDRAHSITESNEFPPLREAEMLSIMRHFIELRLAVIIDPKKPDLKFVGEKDPTHAEHFPVLRKLFPDAKVIHIIRDGRSVVLSAWHHNLRANTPGVKAAGFDVFMNEAAKNWGSIIQMARKSASVLGDNYLEIRYEDMIPDALPTLKRVLDHLGVDASEATMRACAEAASFEKLSKGRSRGEEDTQSFFRKGLPDDWKTQMTPSQIQRFDARSGGMLSELGYIS